jgi:Dolichyl-phosphate-mannose-protein mannosyltransferase
VTLGQYLLGVALLGVTAGASGLTARVVVTRRLGGLPGYARGAAFGVLAAAALLVATLAPAAVGLLGRASGPICAVALLAAARAFVRSAPAATDREPTQGEPRLSRLLGGAAVALLAGWSIAAAWLGSAIPSDGRDTLTFHLPEAVRWLQTGTIWRVDQFEPLLASGYYPQNGDALNLALLVPFQSEAFVRVLSVSSLLVLAMAVYALARELRAPPGAAALGAALVASLPISVLTAEEGAKTDLWCVAALAVAGLFLIRHLRTGAGTDLLLGSLALGLGLGTKWYGATAAAAVAAGWAIARLAERPRARRFAREAVVVAGLCALGGGLWLVRNWVEAGNPLFPAPVRLAGITLFHAPPDPIRECTGYSVADYAGNPDVLRHVLWPIWRSALGAGTLLLLAGLAATPVLGRPRRRMVGLAVLGAVLLVMYAVLPYSALGGRDQPVLAGPNVRYMLPALALSAALFACVLTRLGRLRPLVELLTVLAVANGLRHGLLVHEGRLAAGVVAALALGALLVVSRRLPRPILTTGLMACALAVAALGFVRQRDFYDGRYRGADPALDVLASAPHGTRVGLAGFESTGILPHVLPSFGEHLGNLVTYVGEDHHGQLRAYEQPARFDAALARGGFDYLLVARGRYLVPCTLPGENADPGGWARAAGWHRVTLTPALALYRRP